MVQTNNVNDSCLQQIRNSMSLVKFTRQILSAVTATTVTGLTTNQRDGRIGTWANLARPRPRFLKERPISDIHQRR